MDFSHFDESFWHGLDLLMRTSNLIIDRPKGSSHPRYPEFQYPVDYGYLEGTRSMDGQGIDVWQGTDPLQRCDGILCILDLHKRDSEIKILFACTEQEKQSIYQAQNTFSMRAILIRRDQRSFLRDGKPLS